jgi:lipoate-protein ligase A
MKSAILDLTLPSLAENLSLDEALLLDADAGNRGESLRFWEWPTHAVVLGASGRLHEEIDEPACIRDGVPIQRRASGGGTVLLGKGCLLFSLVLNMSRDSALTDIHGSYRYILDRLICALNPVAVVAREGISDLAIAGMKISGSAQQRKRHYLLHHGTLLYDFDIAAMRRYLRLPSRQPAYRAARAHDSFVSNLRVDPTEVKARIQSEWNADGRVDPLPLDLTAKLLDEKYRRDDWVVRR